MKPEFLNLVNNGNLVFNYLTYIKESESLFENNDVFKIFRQLITTNNDEYQLRISFWMKILALNPSANDKRLMSNPYFFGYGNPDSNTLFIGHEAAVASETNDAQENNIYLVENIENIFRWNNIVALNNGGNLTFSNLVNEHPAINDMHKIHNPLLYCYDNDTVWNRIVGKGRHTFKICNSIIQTMFGNGIYEIDDMLGNDNRYRLYNNLLFSKSFFTELNYIPSKTTGSNQFKSTIEYRLENYFNNDLVINFHGTFNNVVIGAKSILKRLSNGQRQSLINNLGFNFDNNTHNQINNFINGVADVPFIHFENNGRNLIIGKQLSSSNYSNDNLSDIANHIQQ